jgi:hypothetical protein
MMRKALRTGIMDELMAVKMFRRVFSRPKSLRTLKALNT